MLADELHTILHLKERLAERVVGQDGGLDAVARRVRTSRASLDDPGKPVGVFMLVGPSGVGKTETACALADLLYGGERNLITVNMSEFQEAHSVSSLKGAPPGYVGYGRGGVLTEAVRRRPYAVVLLDEMEKAHPDVLELFFQVFDKGVMDDGEGVQVDFRNTLILLTSNAAQDVITGACLAGQRPSTEHLVQLLRPALLRQFSPAFLGRVVLVPYLPLGDTQIRRIVELKLARLAERFATNHQARFSWDASVAAHITARCTEVDSGARNVDDILTHTVLPEVAALVLEKLSMAEDFSAIHMALGRDGRFSFRFEPAGLPPVGAPQPGRLGEPRSGHAVERTPS
jgi:type VI secretion system protein VasG